jgi:Ku protein
MKTKSPRPLWKGAVNFGLVHIPVALYPAVKRDDIDFDWIDRPDMKPVGYKRVNKKTGKEVPKESIVRGYQYADGRYVVLSDEEIKSANPGGTQSVDILAFADFSELSSLCLEMPYYLAPTRRGEKVYALLREALKRADKIGIAHVVIQTKQHLAALIPAEKPEQKASNVIDLTELLKRSLRSGNRTPATAKDKTSTERKSSRTHAAQAKKEKPIPRRKRA